MATTQYKKEVMIDQEKLVTYKKRSILFGLITYATYDLTNLATLKEWPLKITIIDLIWGTTLSTVVSTVTYNFYMFIKKIYTYMQI